MRRLLLWSGAGLLVAVLAAAGALVALLHGWQRDWLRSQLETRLAAALETPVSVGALEGALHREPTLRGLRMGPAEEPWLAVEGLRLRIGGIEWSAPPTLVLEAVALERPLVWLRRGADGRWPWETGEAEPATAAAWPFLVRVDALSLAGGVLERIETDGERLRAELEGDLAGLRVGPEPAIGELRLSFAAGPPDAAANRLARGSMEASLAAGHWQLDALRVEGPVLQAEATGRGTGAFIEEARVSLRVPSLDALGELLVGRGLGVSGSLEAVADLRGEPPWPQGRLEVQAEGLRTAEGALGDLRLEAVSEQEGRLRLDALELAGGPMEIRAKPGAELRADGEGLSLRGLELVTQGGRGLLSIDAEAASAALGPEGIEGLLRDSGTRLALRAEAWPLEILSSLWPPLDLPIQGLLDAELELRGAQPWPRGRLVAGTRGLRTGDHALDDLRIEAVSDAERRLQLQAQDLRGALRIDVEASLAAVDTAGIEPLLRDPATRMKLRADAWPVETLAPLAATRGLELRGFLDANVELRGQPQGPALKGTASLAAGALRALDGSVEAEDMALVVELDGPLAAPGAHLAATAGALRWQETELGALGAALRIADARSVEIERLVLEGGRLPLRALPGSQLRVEDGSVALDRLALEIDGQRLVLSGGLADGVARKLRLELEGFDVARLASLAQPGGDDEETVELAGRLSGELVWDGPARAPRLAGRLVWSEARLGEFPFERIDADLETEGPSLRVRSEWIRSGAPAFASELSLPADRVLTDPAALLSDPRSTLRLRADDFELAALSAFLPRRVSLAGRLSADLQGRGGDFPLRLSGRLAVEEGSLTLPALAGQKLAPIQVRAALDGSRVEVEELRVGEPGAGVRGTGSLELAGGRPRALDLRLAFERFPIDAPGLVQGTLDGPVELSGSAEAPVLRGSLELGDLNIRIPEPADKELREIQVLAADGEETSLELREGAGATPLLDPLRLDLDVAVARNSWARGRGAEVELAGSMAARKDPGGPVLLSGSLETRRGTYEIYGRRFRIERGSALLDGGAEVDPVLDVRAEHKTRGVRIFALLGGRLSEPTLRFESQPEMSETDIASYLVLGRPASDVGAGQQAALDAVATRIAAGAALREFERAFGGALPVDLLELQMEGEGDQSQVRAGVGKYVGERLFLYYERGFGDEPDDELRAEFELTPLWSVESSVSSEGESGADVIFEVEY